MSANLEVIQRQDSGRIEHFKFDLNQRVLVREIQRPGRVIALTIDYLGRQYYVALWDNGERRNVWLMEDEIEEWKGGAA